MELVALVNSEISKLDALKAHAEHAIKLLKERRNAMVAAAVTGQIDVRASVAEQPTTREELAA